MGTRGSAELRAAEASHAAAVLGVPRARTSGCPTRASCNTPETREKLVRVIRQLPAARRHRAGAQGAIPIIASARELVRDACFLSGLAKLAPDVPKHRPLKMLHSLAYRQDFVKPTFVVDISDEFERKLAAIRCYASQFDGVTQAGEVFPNGEPLDDIVRHQAAYYGSLIRVRYGEPFFTTETMRVDDLLSLNVSTF